MLSGSNNIYGFYGQWQTTLFDQLTLTGGVRHDEDEQYGGHTSLKFAGAWSLFEGNTVLRANYGDGFKSPSLYQRYSQYSNPLVVLDPETSESIEAGIDQFFLDGTVKASVTAFQRKSRNQVDFFSCFGVVSASCALRAIQGGYYYNVKQSRASGLEAMLDITISDELTATLNYTSVTNQNLTANKAMPRRPHDIFNASLTWTPTDALTFGTDLTYTGKQFDDVANTRRLPGYLLIDVTAAYKFDEHFELYGRIENLTDSDYQPVVNYNSAGRAFYAGIRASL
jgi:vitamin B12 transporter